MEKIDRAIARAVVPPTVASPPPVAVPLDLEDGGRWPSREQQINAALARAYAAGRRV